MINRKANSRNQFKIFVKEKGIFRYKEEKNPDGDAPPGQMSLKNL